MSSSDTAVVIGGGFYGLYLAERLAGRFGRVVLCERGEALMERASFANQARVHNGYHYPRSILTALRSRENYPRFLEEFAPAIDASFEKLYAVARRDSKVSADQFVGCMKRIGAAIKPAPPKYAKLFDAAYVEGAFLVEESAFNSNILRDLMAERVRKAGVDVRLSMPVTRVAGGPANAVTVETVGESFVASHVFCCCYSQTNAPGAAGGLPSVPLKHELTEMALVEVPAELSEVGITLMDGPFFSVMPFPPRGLHTLSHVRYTPHGCWYDGENGYRPAYDVVAKAEKRTAFPFMIRDAARYVPALAGCQYRESLWEVKTVLPRSETDDSRPILFRPNHGIPGYHLVMGGKIDNVYDVMDVICQTFGWR